MEHSAALSRTVRETKRPPAAGVLSVLILFLLLTNPAATLTGARNGLLLWSGTVLPTLLPFMICSNVIVSAGGLPLLMAPLRPLLKNIFSLSDAGGYVLISGLLCGYPMGAKTCAEFLEQGRISPEEARYLLAVSNHPSPMFVLGYLAANLCSAVPIWLVVLSLYLPVLPLSALARRFYLSSCTGSSVQAGRLRPSSPAFPAQGRHFRLPSSAPSAAERVSDRPVNSQNAEDTFDAIMMRSFEVMVRIGGYIMLFSILAVFIERLPFLPAAFKALLLGTAEITTGIRAISQTMDGYRQGFWLTAVTAFGGLSGIFQTRSVITGGSPLGSLPAKNAGLSIRHYILWKLLHTFTACLLYSFLPALPGLLRP